MATLLAWTTIEIGDLQIFAPTVRPGPRVGLVVVYVPRIDDQARYGSWSSS